MPAVGRQRPEQDQPEPERAAAERGGRETERDEAHRHVDERGGEQLQPGSAQHRPHRRRAERQRHGEQQQASSQATTPDSTSPTRGTSTANVPRDEPGPPAAVRVRGLRVRCGEHDVLEGVDLDVHPSEVVVLLGPNGAGKTTTIEILEGFRRPSAGTVDQLARRIRSRAEVRWSVGGQRFVHAAADATDFVRRLLAERPTGIEELEVRRASLEDTYLELVRAHEDGDAAGVPLALVAEGS